MASLLLLSADPRVLDRVNECCQVLTLRLRTVAAPAAAREWLSMQSFDVVLVDSRYGSDAVLEVLNFAWKLHPLLLGGVIDPGDVFADRWTVQALGAQIFHGRLWDEEAHRFLESLPELFIFGEQDRAAVLVVEDIDSPRDIIRAYIEALGYHRVDGAASAQEAMSLLLKEPESYFCVVADIMMPLEDGISLTRRIRSHQDPAIAALPVLMLTAVPTTDNLINAIKAGATGFLVKPPKKIILKKELEKAKRIVLTKRSPRLCSEKDAHLVEAGLRKLGVG